jgi:hypothetical protein
LSAFRKFDPYANSGSEASAKAAQAAKGDAEIVRHKHSLAGLATLAVPTATSSNPLSSSVWSEREVVSPDRDRPASIAVLATPMTWIAGLEAFDQKPCPIAVEPKRWLQLQEDTKHFVDRWGKQAAALGWSALNIFGCHPERPADRYDFMGLIWIIAGADIRAMGTDVVTLQTRSGALQRTWKCGDVRGQILVWELAPGGSDFPETTP